VELLQPARPLADEVTRLAGDIAGTGAALDAARPKAASRRRRSAAGRRRAAGHGRPAGTGSGTARRGAALDQAKALDAGIAAHLPAHRQAQDGALAPTGPTKRRAPPCRTCSSASRPCRRNRQRAASGWTPTGHAAAG
jgi:hypothetical protein